MKKRVLIITYYWPPTGGSGVQRWVKFAKYLPQEGWQPVIYTPLNPEQIAFDNSLLADIPIEAEILRKKIIEPATIYGFFRKRSSSGTEVNPINGEKKGFLKNLSLFVRGNFFIPDPRVWWVNSSVRWLKEYLKEHPVDIIVSTGPPHSMHLIARKLSKVTDIPWVADFRDPWTKMFYFKHLSLTECSEKKHRKLEKEVLDDSTAVIAVTPFVQKDFQEMTSTPVHLITNGFDEDDFEIRMRSHSHFNVVHTGLFASDGIPTVLWDVLAEKVGEDPEFSAKLHIRLAGKTDREVFESLECRGLGNRVIDMGYQTHNVAVREQKSASLLILPLRKDPEYKKTYPGKVFEYLAARRPILGIGQEDGAMAGLLKQTGTGTVCDWNNKEGIKNAVDTAWERYKSGDEPLEDGTIAPYSRRELTHNLAGLLDSIIKD